MIIINEHSTGSLCGCEYSTHRIELKRTAKYCTYRLQVLGDHGANIGGGGQYSPLKNPPVGDFCLVCIYWVISSCFLSKSIYCMFNVFTARFPRVKKNPTKEIKVMAHVQFPLEENI